LQLLDRKERGALWDSQGLKPTSLLIGSGTTKVVP